MSRAENELDSEDAPKMAWIVGVLGVIAVLIICGSLINVYRVGKRRQELLKRFCQHDITLPATKYDFRESPKYYWDELRDFSWGLRSQTGARKAEVIFQANGKTWAFSEREQSHLLAREMLPEPWRDVTEVTKSRGCDVAYHDGAYYVGKPVEANPGITLFLLLQIGSDGGSDWD